MIVVVMGIAGCGKTHVGRALAAALGWPFHDADDFHLPESIASMRAGVPLTDADREPWLQRLRALLLQVDASGQNAVLACSALRRNFRERLRENIADVRFVFLQADRGVLAQRLRDRQGHFMPASLLESQLETLEQPDDALPLDAASPADMLVAQIRTWLDTTPLH
ncbi:MAG TPA: gluconokinase [Thermoanaerobaculia bacterium]